MVARVLAAAVLERFGGDSIGQVVSHVGLASERVSRRLERPMPSDGQSDA
jgi:hypothetical protein